VYAKLPLEHADAIDAYYRSDRAERLWVMGLRASERIGTDRILDVTQLSRHSPLEPIAALYADYPGNSFEASQLDSGLYHATHADGRLASIAGTHVLAPEEGIAVIGIVVTAAPARRNGHASACTASLIDGLAAMGCETVALQVAADNAAAIACYRNLGFRFRGIALQTRCSRVQG
jgi:RimJ/RimL family protein N-acetyltransferase